MIVYPDQWEKVGQPISLTDIESAIMEIISSMDCDCLAYSGGIDSSLLLWFMHKTKKRVWAYTIGCSHEHPDIEHARLYCAALGGVDHRVFMPSNAEIKAEQRAGDLLGDDAVRLFYKFTSQYTDKIIAGDGIDEFMCGYYAHQERPYESTYYEFLHRLKGDQLSPLHFNSGDVKVFLPYLAPQLISLLSQIPLSMKVSNEGRKLLMGQMAMGKMPESIINRRKYGFCDALQIKGVVNVTA